MIGLTFARNHCQQTDKISEFDAEEIKIVGRKLVKKVSTQEYSKPGNHRRAEPKICTVEYYYYELDCILDGETYMQISEEEFSDELAYCCYELVKPGDVAESLEEVNEEETTDKVILPISE